MEKERLAKLEERSEWTKSALERIELKQDQTSEQMKILSEKISFGFGKIFGASAIIAILATIITDWIRK